MTIPAVLLALLGSLTAASDAGQSLHVAIQIVGLDEVQWEDEARDTGLTPDQRRTLRADIQRAVEQAFQSAGLATRQRGYPLFVIGVRTSRARQDGEYVVTVGARLCEKASFTRQPRRRPCVSVWSGRTAVETVAVGQIQHEVLIEATSWAEQAAARLREGTGHQGIGPDGHAPR
jgi:hypothetical protein